MHREAAHMQKPALNVCNMLQTELLLTWKACDRGQHKNAQVKSCLFKTYTTVVITMSPR